MSDLSVTQKSVLSGLFEIRDYIGGGSVGIVGTISCIFAIDKATLRKTTYMTAKEFFRLNERDQVDVLKVFIDESLQTDKLKEEKSS